MKMATIQADVSHDVLRTFADDVQPGLGHEVNGARYPSLTTGLNNAISVVQDLTRAGFQAWIEHEFD